MSAIAAIALLLAGLAGFIGMDACHAIVDIVTKSRRG